MKTNLAITSKVVPSTCRINQNDNATAGINLIGLPRQSLIKILRGINVPEKHLNMRLKQIWMWIYCKGVGSFQDMTNINKSLRAVMNEKFNLKRPKIITCQISVDGTRKYVLQMDDGCTIETVYIPEKNRGTLCLSSQIGCTLTCPFCHTGRQRLVRNLTVGEIVGQVMVVRDDIKDWSWGQKNSQKTNRLISNIVLMGMGEPLYNTDNIIDAMIIIMDNAGISLSRRRITLSTSGIVPNIFRVGAKIGCMLAISLHATTDDLRDKLVPINRKYKIAQLLQACRNYPRRSNAERITFEYVMLKNINDSNADARRLVQLIAAIPAKINLIPFNPWPGSFYECSDAQRIKTFAAIINKAGYASPIRTPRGQDILAACGQLKTISQRRRKIKTI